MKKDAKSKEQAEQKEKIAQLEEQVKRTLADYQNLEKRVLEERKDWIRSSNRELLLRILPVLDTLITASKHSAEQILKVSVAQFLDILKGEGVEKIETVGKIFDPIIMEAVTTGEGEESKVLEEIRAGYTLYGKTLRAAQVKVGKPVS